MLVRLGERFRRSSNLVVVPNTRPLTRGDCGGEKASEPEVRGALLREL